MNFFPSLCTGSGAHGFELLPLSAGRAGGDIAVDSGLYAQALRWLRHLEELGHVPRPQIENCAFAFTLCLESASRVFYSDEIENTLGSRGLFCFGRRWAASEWLVGVRPIGRGSALGISNNLQIELDAFLVGLEEQSAIMRLDDELRAAIEEIVILWREVAESVPPQDRRVGDALCSAAEEVVLVDDPPKAALRGMLAWFRGRAGMWADAAIVGSGDAFGKAFGATAGIGAGATVSGQLPRLVALVEKAIRLLG